MKKIGVLSDTHGWLDPKVFEYFAQCDEIWHAGDIGSISVYDKLNEFKPLRAVFGNIDDYLVRNACSEFLTFNVENVKVLLTHIGGYPNKFYGKAYQKILQERPAIFVCGHSHILKVMYDQSLNMLCINPGAAGMYGIQPSRTFLRFEIDGEKIQNMEVIDLVVNG
ncbi:MAG: metallophosphatase family protein [Prevotellaceae bacterium]|jgi:putative phosphoesterase|nr:metallophosphatase family protein [Prevotellaceae bacterium]